MQEKITDLVLGILCRDCVRQRIRAAEKGEERLDFMRGVCAEFPDVPADIVEKCCHGLGPAGKRSLETALHLCRFSVQKWVDENSRSG